MRNGPFDERELAQATLVGAALLADEEWRNFLLSDPVAAANELGLEITDTQAAQIRGVSRSEIARLVAEMRRVRSASARW